MKKTLFAALAVFCAFWGGCGGGSAPIKNKTPPDLASEIIVPE